MFKRKPKLEAVHGLVTGRVQSVAFRFYTRQEATQLRLSGWVKNLGDGRVEFHVQGLPERVAEFVQWVHVGPPLAKVRDVETTPAEPEALDEFEIR